MKRVGIRSQGNLNAVTRTGNLPCQAMLLIGPLWQKDWVRHNQLKCYAFKSFIPVSTFKKVTLNSTHCRKKIVLQWKTALAKRYPPVSDSDSVEGILLLCKLLKTVSTAK